MVAALEKAAAKVREKAAAWREAHAEVEAMKERAAMALDDLAKARNDLERELQAIRAAAEAGYVPVGDYIKEVKGGGRMRPEHVGEDDR